MPIRDPGPAAFALIDAIKMQSLQVERVLVLDSCSSDGFVEHFKKIGAEIYLVPDGEFDHGGTRRIGTEILQAIDVVIFLTQDAIPYDSMAFEELVEEFEDPMVGVVYGRQMPRKNATLLEAHARLFNYPPVSTLKSMNEVGFLGAKTVFLSNSFSAYRQSSLSDIGGFPKSCIVSEDTYVGAKMLLSGWKIAYCSEARVFHSHNYSLLNEFRRYFDIGVFHSQAPWIKQKFGAVESEGRRFALSEIKYIWPDHWWLFPLVIFKTIIKYIGFRVGKIERLLPVWLKLRLTMHPLFFLNFPKH